MFYNMNDVELKSQQSHRVPPGGFDSVRIYDQSSLDKSNAKTKPHYSSQSEHHQYNEHQLDNNNVNQERAQRKVHVGEDVRTMAEGAKKFLLFQLRRRGSGSGLQLQQRLEAMDTSGDGVVSFSEFRDALMELNMAENQIHCLFRYFDADCNGYLDKHEFLEEVIPQLNQKRTRLAQAAFQKLDQNGNDVVDLAETAITYNVNQHPDFLNGKKSKNQILTEFLEGFGKVEEGQITLKQWLIYYRYIGALIEDDEYFEVLMRNAWNLGDDAGQSNSRFERYSQQQQPQNRNNNNNNNNSRDINISQSTQLRKPSGSLGSTRISKITQASIAFG